MIEDKQDLKEIRGTIGLTNHEQNMVLGKEPLIDFILNCGLRISPTLFLINSKEEVKPIMLAPVKNSKGHYVEVILNSKAQELLKELRYSYKYRGKDRFWAGKLIKSTLYKYTGKNHFSPHSLRKTFATNLLYNCGVELATIKELLHHKKLETTILYIGVPVQNKIDSVELLVKNETFEGMDFNTIKSLYLKQRIKLLELEERIKEIENEKI